MPGCSTERAGGRHARPLLRARLAGERKQIERMSAGLVQSPQRLYALPWLGVPPIGLAGLSKLVRPQATAI